MKYRFKKGARVSGDAQAVGEALDKIRRRKAGLTPRTCVDAARPEGHVLHPHFEWDDAKAADCYRLDQAREVIQAVVVDFEEVENPPRAFHSVVVQLTDDTAERRYEPLSRILENESYRTQVLNETRQTIQQLIAKLEGLEAEELLISLHASHEAAERLIGAQ